MTKSTKKTTTTKRKTTTNSPPSNTTSPAPFGAGLKKKLIPNIAVCTGMVYPDEEDRTDRSRYGGMCGFSLIYQYKDPDRTPKVKRDTVRMVFVHQARRDEPYVTDADCYLAGMMRMLRALPRGWDGTVMCDDLRTIHRVIMANQPMVQSITAEWEFMNLAHRRLLIKLVNRLGKFHVKHVEPHRNKRVIGNVLAIGSEFWAKQVEGWDSTYGPLYGQSNKAERCSMTLPQLTYELLEREDRRCCCLTLGMR